MVLYLVFAALGSLWMPVKILPAPLQTVAHMLPSNRVAELGWRIAACDAPSITAALILAMWFVGAATAAVTLSRRVAIRG
jgi:ABC-2 type transport system permease protein